MNPEWTGASWGGEGYGGEKGEYRKKTIEDFDHGGKVLRKTM